MFLFEGISSTSLFNIDGNQAALEEIPSRLIRRNQLQINHRHVLYGHCGQGKVTKLQVLLNGTKLVNIRLSSFLFYFKSDF